MEYKLDQTAGKLRFNTHNGPISFDTNEILFLKGARSYVEVYSEQGNLVFTLTRNLHFMDKLLEKDHFMLCHRSWLVNIRKIRGFSRKRRVLIIEEYEIPVSRRKWKYTTQILADCGIKPIKIDFNIKNFNRS